MIGEYDIELMTLEELQQYVEALEDECMKMRKALNFHQSDKKELLDMLSFTQEKIEDRKRRLIQKDLALQELMTNCDENIAVENNINLLIERESKIEESKNVFKSFLERESIEMIHKEKERGLKNDILSTENKIREVQLLDELVAPESKEEKEEKELEFSEYFHSIFKKTLHEHLEDFQNTKEEFHERKMEKIREIFENTAKVLRETDFASFVDNMFYYFSDVFSKNAKTFLDLKNKVPILREERERINSHLQDVLQENETLESSEIKTSAIDNPIKKFKGKKQDSEQVIKELTYENFVLARKLELLTSEHDAMSKKFATVVRRIYRKADFKELALENMVKSKLNTKQTDEKNMLDEK